MKYSKPPLVEVYCEFSFDPNEGEEWDGLRISNFISHLGSEYPHRRMLRPDGGRSLIPEEEPTAQEQDTFDGPDHLFRFATDDGTTTIRIGENLLVLNQLPPYGWSNFRERVLGAIEAYQGTWGPKRVAAAYLHYVDRVFIPGNDVRFADYFNLYPVIPDGFNKPFTNLSLSFDLGGHGKDDVLSVAMQQEPPIDPDGTIFMLNWGYWSTKSVELDATRRELTSWLETAHDCCVAHFETLFTERCLTLFEPLGVS